jgi:hypothetical protein
LGSQPSLVPMNNTAKRHVDAHSMHVHDRHQAMASWSTYTPLVNGDGLKKRIAINFSSKPQTILKRINFTGNDSSFGRLYPWPHLCYPSGVDVGR